MGLIDNGFLNFHPLNMFLVGTVAYICKVSVQGSLFQRAT